MLQLTVSQQFNEIMPTIYSRFMEKEAREWRQIYKVRVAMGAVGDDGSADGLGPYASRVPCEARIRACRRRRPCAHLHHQDASQLPLHR